MAAYMVVLAELTDRDGFMKYAVEAAKLIPQFGGEYIVRGPSESERLEGDWPDGLKVVVSKWPDLAAARAFWNSPEYAEVKKLREGKARVQVRLVDGVPES